MTDINIALVLGLTTSLYGNYIYRKYVKNIIEIGNRDLKKCKKEIEEINGTLENKDEIIKKQEISLKEYRKTNESLKKQLDNKQEECIEIKSSYEFEKKEKEKYFHEYEEFFRKYNTQLKNNELLSEDFKNKETELYNLDWAYDELMKAYNSNALDLYFWNLLRSADRETRRKFIKSGKYRVCSLEDGRIAFEVI